MAEKGREEEDCNTRRRDFCFYTSTAAAVVGYSGLLGFHSLSLSFAPHLNPISASALADFDVCRSTTAAAAAASFCCLYTLSSRKSLGRAPISILLFVCSVLFCCVFCWLSAVGGVFYCLARCLYLGSSSSSLFAHYHRFSLSLSLCTEQQYDHHHRRRLLLSSSTGQVKRTTRQFCRRRLLFVYSSILRPPPPPPPILASDLPLSSARQ